MTSAQEVVQKAAREIGYKESPPGSNSNKYGAWYGQDNVAWCAIFVSYCTYNAGIPLPIQTRLGFSYCPSAVSWFRKQGKFINRDAQKIGDLVFFCWRGDGVADHVGIVEKVYEDGSILSIEGNTSIGNDSNGGQVMRRKRSRALILGYGRLDYNEGLPNPPGNSFPVWPGRYITLASPLTTGDDIQTWQQKMLERGYDLGDGGADGIFGERSYTALLQFQEIHNDVLEVDGIIGPKTWNATWELVLRPVNPVAFSSPFETPSRTLEKLVTTQDYSDFSYFYEPWRSRENTELLDNPPI